MIIDTHVHRTDGVWPPGSTPGYTPERLIEDMDRLGIEQVWLSDTGAMVGDFKAQNRKLYKDCRHSPERIIGYGVVNPNLDGAVDEVRRCAGEYGFKGIKLHPWLSAFSVAYACSYRIVEECVRFNLPILYHDGTPPYCDSLQIAHLAGEFPESIIILGHAGLFDNHRSAVAAARRYPNIWLCLCGPAIGDLRYIIENADNDRLLFGSDFDKSATLPVFFNRVSKLKLAAPSPELQDKIFYQNPKRLLSLSNS